MLLVAGSGIMGRFVYTKIHHGLYGRSANLKEIKAHFMAQSEDVKTKFHFAPHVEQWMHEFEAYALNDALPILAPDLALFQHRLQGRVDAPKIHARNNTVIVTTSPDAADGMRSSMRVAWPRRTKWLWPI